MTLLLRNEADILDAHLAYHLAAGVDFVVATDHRSDDGSSEILERYSQAGVVHVVREESQRMRQSDWVTRMARQAAALGADWVINSDADEFWWPRGGNLRDVLAAVPEEYGAIWSFDVPFVARPEDGRAFWERMTVALTPQAPINDPASIFRPLPRIVHRASPDVVVGIGSHSLLAGGLAELHWWMPIEAFHFPIRSVAQVGPKAAAHVEAFSSPGSRVGNAYHERAFREAAEGRAGRYYATVAVSDDELAEGVAAGCLVEDTRLRDALRSLQQPGGGGFRPAPELRDALSFGPPTVEEAVRNAVAAATWAEASLVRVRRRADLLERRFGAIERSSLAARAARRRRGLPQARSGRGVAVVAE